MHKRQDLLLLLLLPALLAARCSRDYRLPPRPTQKLTPTVELAEDLRLIELQFHKGLLTLEPGPRLTCHLQIDLLADDDEKLDQLAARVAPRIDQLSEDSRRLSVELPTGAPMDAVRTTWRLVIPPGVDVVARTRHGSVVSRGAPGDLTVQGGTGVVDVCMAGGHADLSTSSGSLLLRGDYPSAKVRSQQGRVDAQLPPITRDGLVDVQIDSELGTIYLDLHREQQFFLFFSGEEHQVRCDPDVRVAWEQLVPGQDREMLQGRLGDLRAQPPRGQIRLATQQTVHVRLRPVTDQDSTQTRAPHAAR